jgi:hypothetical protein
MEFKDTLVSAIKAGYCYFYVQSYELARASQEIKSIVDSFNGYTSKVWDFAVDPDVDAAFLGIDDMENKSVLIMKNLNWFLKGDGISPDMADFDKTKIAFLQNRYELFSNADTRRVLIIVSDQDFSNAIPPPVQKMFFSLEFGLPGVEEIKKQYDIIIESAKSVKEDFKAPDEQTEQDILLSCRGMTSREISDALSFSLIQDKGTLNPGTVAQIRAKGIEKVAGIKVGKYDVTFESLKGYENLKEFCKSTIRHPLAKGVMLLGPPGTGKTHFARCLGNESGLEVYEMEFAQMTSKYQGEFSRMVGEAIKITSANAPCILFLDEIEKMLAGVGGGQEDGGTSKQALGQFLKFLSDGRPEGIYVIATCNSIKQLPPEWVRAERWDTAPFFIDLPNESERSEILKFYQDKFNVEGSPKNMEGWSGAEIKAVCRIAKMMSRSVVDVERFVVPISKTMGKEIDTLRKWSVDKTIPATIKMPEKNLRSLNI